MPTVVITTTMNVVYLSAVKLCALSQQLLHSSLLLLVCGSTGLWFQQSVVPRVCGSSGQGSVASGVFGSTGLSVAPGVCGSSGLWLQGFVAPGVCGSRGLWLQGSVVPGDCGSRSLWLQGIKSRAEPSCLRIVNYVDGCDTVCFCSWASPVDFDARVERSRLVVMMC